MWLRLRMRKLGHGWYLLWAVGHRYPTSKISSIGARINMRWWWWRVGVGYPWRESGIG